MGGDDVAWLEGLSPWPTDGFGLERMALALLWHHGTRPDRWPRPVRELLGA